jgi:predicted dehydrogenase
MIRVGIAGIGFMGMTHYRAYGKIRGVKVAALCEKNFPDRLAGDWRSIKGNFGEPGGIVDLSGVAKYTELDDMFADPSLDLIDCCLPPAAHAKVAIAAMKAGRHVFCEKPIALTAADAIKMTQTAEQTGRLLFIGHVLPFNAEYKFVYDAMISGKYGQLLGGHFKRLVAVPTWLPRFFDPAVVGGPMLDLHVHDAHFIRLVFGMPKAVQTIGSMHGEVAELFTTQFTFDPAKTVTAASGAIGQQGRPFTCAFEIYFEKATMFYEYAAMPTAGDIVTPLTVLLDNGKVLRPKLAGTGPVDAFEAELAEVVRCVKTNAPSKLLAGDLARDAIIICQKETQSIVRGRAVKVAG